MSAEPSGDDKPVLRPLPSVGMALLPNELRARRTRRWIVVGTLAAVVLGFLFVWLIRSVLPEAWAWSQEAEQLAPIPTATAVATAPLDEDALAPEPTLSPEERLALERSRPNARYETPFGGVPSFRGALLNAGLGPEECTDIEQALEHIVDFRRCRPEHTLVIERDENGALKHFEYHPSATEFVAVSRDDDGLFRAEQIRIQVERRPIARAASVQTSIGDGLEQIGLPPGFSAFFTEAFEGRINFPLQARRGDVFRIVLDEERVDGEFLRFGRIHALEYHGQKTGKEQAFYYHAGDAPPQFYDVTGRAMQGGWLRTPLRYDRLSSGFNPRRFHPILKRVMPHLGVDYAAATGTPVWAAADGRVKFAGRSGPNGNLVVIRHTGGYETFYAHLHRIKGGIRPGTQVEQRELIGFVGSTGRSTGPHLHFGLKKYARYIDPAKELNGPGRRLPPRELAHFKEAIADHRARMSDIPNAPALVEGEDEPLVEPVEEIMD